MVGNPKLPKDSQDGRPGHSTTVLGGRDSEKCPLLFFLGSPGCRGAGLATQEQMTLKRDYQPLSLFHMHLLITLEHAPACSPPSGAYPQKTPAPHCLDFPVMRTMS